MDSDNEYPLLEAVSFAARAHRHQLRKDGETPYAAHPMRVALIVTRVFGVQDLGVLVTALLHDTIEDTPTDYDDIASRFGPTVADWVAILTKEMRLPETDREKAYIAGLSRACWQVAICKLADLYDNLTSSQTLSPDQRARTGQRARTYLAALEAHRSGPAATAYARVEALFQRLHPERQG